MAWVIWETKICINSHAPIILRNLFSNRKYMEKVTCALTSARTARGVCCLSLDLGVSGPFACSPCTICRWYLQSGRPGSFPQDKEVFQMARVLFKVKKTVAYLDWLFWCAFSNQYYMIFLFLPPICLLGNSS